MTLLEHLREWWTTRRQPTTFGPIRCSIHTGEDLGEIHRFAIAEDDLLSAEVSLGTLVAVALEVPAASPRGSRIMHAGVGDGETAFVRVTFAGTEQWLRMQSWTRDPGDVLTVRFSRQYTAQRWNPIDNFYTEPLVEPSPPVPFDERHPHYEGSAQQEFARRRAAAEATA